MSNWHILYRYSINSILIYVAIFWSLALIKHVLSEYKLTEEGFIIIPMLLSLAISFIIIFNIDLIKWYRGEDHYHDRTRQQLKEAEESNKRSPSERTGGYIEALRWELGEDN
jgi:hypothetical protein